MDSQAPSICAVSTLSKVTYDCEVLLARDFPRQGKHMSYQQIEVKVSMKGERGESGFAIIRPMNIDDQQSFLDAMRKLINDVIDSAYSDPPRSADNTSAEPKA
jgi:hypothetical protein